MKNLVVFYCRNLRTIAFLSVHFPRQQMKKKLKLTFTAIALGIAIWNFWPHQATEIKTAKAVTSAVIPTVKKLSRHTVAKKQIADETEKAFNKHGLSMANSFGVSAQSN